MNAIQSIFGAALFATSGAVFAQADLIGTASLVRTGANLEIGMASDGQVHGLQFDVKAPKGVSFANANLSNCLGGLPAAFSGSTCTLIDEQTIRVVVLSLSSEAVPSTILGTISLTNTTGSTKELTATRGLNAKSLSGIKFENVVIGGAGGKRIEPGLVNFSIDSNRYK
jgi:hypothetical protein